MKSTQNKMINSSRSANADSTRNQGDLREIKNQGDMKDVTENGGSKDRINMTRS